MDALIFGIFDGQLDGFVIDSVITCVENKSTDVNRLSGLIDRLVCLYSRRTTLRQDNSRGLGRFDGLLLGSVSSAVAAHAHCSVEVVRQAAILKTPFSLHEAVS